MVLTNTLSPIAVPTFFTISGFLFFRKTADHVRLKMQIIRILKLYLVWSAIYLPLNIRGYTKDAISFIKGCIDYIQNAVFNGTFFHLWYLPALVFALISVYFLCKHLSTGKVLVLTGVLFLIGCLTDTFNFWCGGLQKIADSYRTIFLTTRNGLFFGMIFVFAGKMIAEYEDKLCGRSRAIWLILAVVAPGLMCESYYLIAVHGKTIINMNLMSLPVSVALTSISILMSDKVRVKNAVLLRNMSTLIFCCHPWIMYLVSFAVIHTGLNINAYLKAGIVIMVTTVISYAIAKMRSRMEMLKCLM